VDSVPFETIVYEKDGPVARIVLNVPEKANIQTAQQVWDMDEALKLADQDDEVKVLILKANGAGFCAGHAIVGPDEMPEVYPTTGPTPEATWKHHHYGLFLWPPLRLWEFPKATIAQVHGYCVGGGTVYGLLTDLIETAVEEIARTIAQMPLTTIMATKAGLKRAWEMMGMRVHLQQSTDLVAFCTQAADVRAFMASMSGLRPRQKAAVRADEVVGPEQGAADA